VTELEDYWVAYRVEHRVAVAAAGDEASVVEQLEMLGDVGLVAVEGFDQFADGLFSDLKLLEDTQAEGLAEGAESPGD
jgi:hypothetical protein